MSISHNCCAVRRSRIHLCRAAHPEGEVDSRAGGGVEGKERHCVTRVFPCVCVNQRPL